jgi:hypothetical protein
MFPSRGRNVTAFRRVLMAKESAMNDNHRSNADFYVPEKPKDKAKDAGKDDVRNEDHADDTVEQETEEMFDSAEDLPEEDSA